MKGPYPQCWESIDGNYLHNDRNKDRRSDALEQHIGKWLKHCVRDKEDGECGIVLSHGQTKVLAQPRNFGVSDVGAVEEGEKVEEAELFPSALDE